MSTDQPGPGSYALSEADGTVVVRTFREGLASRVGHDLTIAVTRWTATVEVPESGLPAARITARLAADSFEVRTGTGGVKPLTDGDRREIRTAIDQKILRTGRHPTIEFVSSGLAVDGDSAVLSGELTIMGTARPVTVTLRAAPAAGGLRVTGDGTVRQSRWGVKPYSALFGTLKLRDEVDVGVEVLIPGS